MTDKPKKPAPRKKPAAKSTRKGPGGTSLTDEQQRWLVCRFACHGRLAKVVDEFEEQFGKAITPNTARNYDMRAIRDEEHAKERHVVKWWAVHKDAAKAYSQSIASIPIADATYRLEKIDEMFEIAYERRNYKSAMALLEQAAKETGGAYSNKRQIEGAVEHNHHHEEVPIDAQRSVIAEKIAEAMAALVATGGAKPDTASTKH